MAIAEQIDGLPRCHLAESARWDGERWWWLDATEGRVWSGMPDAEGRFTARLEHYFGGRTSLVQPLVDGRRFVVRGAAVLLGSTNPLGMVAELPARPGEVFNDGTIDDLGRLLIGTVASDRKPLGGRVLRVAVDGTIDVVLEGFTLSNGMGWRSPTELLHADSLERKVWLHDLARRRTSEVFAEFQDGLPDGLAVDGGGSVWVAVYGTGEARQLDAGGTVRQVVTVPTPQVTSVAVGGPDGRDLLVTTAREGYTAEESRLDQGAGRLFLARGVCG